MRITLFDNHDSFTWNLAHDLERGDATVKVVRDGEWSDEVWLETDALVLSPGPGLPEEHPQLMAVTAEAVQRKMPVLGVCLGMQALALHWGGRLVNLDAPLHGRRTTMNVDAPSDQRGPLATMWTSWVRAWRSAVQWVVAEDSLAGGACERPQQSGCHGLLP